MTPVTLTRMARDARMFTIALSFTKHTTIRFEELAGAALAVGGALTFIGSGLPVGRRGGQARCPAAC